MKEQLLAESHRKAIKSILFYVIAIGVVLILI